MKLIWSKRAVADLEQVGDFIAKDQPERARNFVQTLIERAQQAVQFPYSGRIVPKFNEECLREIIEGNYRIVYEIFEAKEIIVVVTVFEAHKLLKGIRRK